MKVLYLSNAHGADYMCDMLMHGFRSLLGPDLVDVNKLDFMYQGAERRPFYTVYNNLPDIEVDRSDVETKIRSHYFDLVVYGSVHRCRDHIQLVLDHYSSNQIVFIDGEDDHSFVDFHRVGYYFKRECGDEHPPSIKPIQFCVPKEKIRPFDVPKTQLMSTLIPGDHSTYIWYGEDGEKRYYDQYQQSYFARTKKKGGWDCCRHYEIMAAGALPFFEDLESCPEKTLNWLPKYDLITARALFYEWEENYETWAELSARVRNNLLQHLTTEAMAKYVLDTVRA